MSTTMLNPKKTDSQVPMIGTIGAVVIGGLIAHWFTKGGNPQAMMTAPDDAADWWTLIATAGSLGFVSQYVGMIPVVGPWIVKALKVISGMGGTGKKIKDLIPPKLISDIRAIVTGGPPSLTEIMALLSEFHQIDIDLIKQLIIDEYNAIHKQKPVPGPTDPVDNPNGPVASGRYSGFSTGVASVDVPVVVE